MNYEEPIETILSFVNTWEADENGHLNVQFYSHHFQAAEIQFAVQAGLAGDRLDRPMVRHIRYHSELFPGALIAVKSGILIDG